MFGSLSLGITSKCNANCFFCDRNMFDNYQKNVDMPLSTIEKLIPHFEQFALCGSFGDFICHEQSLEILKMLNASKTAIFVDTNAGIRNSSYWTKFGQVMDNPKNIVRFNIDSIDGEFDKYRGVKIANVLDNLETFLTAGGNAMVKIIQFSYNENQIIRMLELFKKMGIYTVQIQTSRMYNETGDLSAPSGVIKGSIQSLYEIVEATNPTIKTCKWKDRGDLSVTERGELHPCCHLDCELTTLIHNGKKIFTDFVMERYNSKSCFDKKLIELYHKCRDEININKSSFETAYNSEYIQYAYNNITKSKKCQQYCGLDDSIMSLMFDVKTINLQ